MDQPDTPTEKTPPSPEVGALARTERAAAELNAKISLGLASKRKAESWEQFEDRVIQMFREKGLFKNDRPA
jgi:hypothetical protein